MERLAEELFKSVQSKICSDLESIDNQKFITDIWDRVDHDGSPGGGGISRVLTGSVFEKAGVNFSKVYGTPPPQLAELGCEGRFLATGVSLVIHPYSPMVPTIHANFRFISVGEKSWFGGGIDLTPYYLDEAQVRRFHQTIKECCDRHDLNYYSEFKNYCDKYFYLPHRQEHRGVGGIFFDYLGKDESSEKYFNFVEDISRIFSDLYLPIVIENKDLEFSDEQKKFQLYRRGRYVEFNLLYDRGTKFGLETNGRTESILMSLPPVAHWDYCFDVKEHSEESKLMNVIRRAVNWA